MQKAEIARVASSDALDPRFQESEARLRDIEARRALEEKRLLELEALRQRSEQQRLVEEERARGILLEIEKIEEFRQEAEQRWEQESRYLREEQEKINLEKRRLEEERLRGESARRLIEDERVWLEEETLRLEEARIELQTELKQLSEELHSPDALPSVAEGTPKLDEAAALEEQRYQEQIAQIRQREEELNRVEEDIRRRRNDIVAVDTKRATLLPTSPTNPRNGLLLSASLRTSSNKARLAVPQALPGDVQSPTGSQPTPTAPTFSEAESEGHFRKSSTQSRSDLDAQRNNFLIGSARTNIPHDASAQLGHSGASFGTMWDAGGLYPSGSMQKSASSTTSNGPQRLALRGGVRSRPVTSDRLSIRTPAHQNSGLVYRSNPTGYSDTNSYRSWRDIAGHFLVQARYLGVVDNQVHLRRRDGVHLSITIDRLSHEDQEFIDGRRGMDVPEYDAMINEFIYDGFNWYDFFRQAGISAIDAVHYAQLFVAARMDGSMLADLDRALLRELGVATSGDIIRIVRAVERRMDPGTISIDRLISMTGNCLNSPAYAPTRPQTSSFASTAQPFAPRQTYDQPIFTGGNVGYFDRPPQSSGLGPRSPFYGTWRYYPSSVSIRRC